MPRRNPRLIVDPMTPLVSRIRGFNEATSKLREAGDRIRAVSEAIAATPWAISQAAHTRLSRAIAGPAMALEDARNRMEPFTGITGKLGHAVGAFAKGLGASHAAIDSLRFVEGFTAIEGTIADTNKALAATSTAAMVANLSHSPLAATAAVLANAYTKRFCLEGEAMGLLMRELSGGTYAETLSIAALAIREFGGRRGAQLISSQIKELADAASHSKIAIEAARGLLDMLDHVHRRVAGLSGAGRLRMLPEMHLGPEIVPLLDHLNEVQALAADPGGKLAAMFAAANRASRASLAMLTRNISELFGAIGGPALGAIDGRVKALASHIPSLAAATRLHGAIAEWVTLGLPEIASGATWPASGVEDLGRKIRPCLRFSPAQEGVLRELHHVRMIETIAEMMRLAPVLTAMARVAQAAAAAGPIVAWAPMAAPAAAPVALGASVRREGGMTITINYSPVVNLTGSCGAARDELTKALADHARELVDIVDREMARRDRTKF